MGIDYYAMGQRIRKLRLERNLTQDQLAELLDFSGRGYISRIENGTSVFGLETLACVAEAFEKPLAYLTDGILTSLSDYLYPELESAVRELSPHHRRAVVLLAQNLVESQKRKIY